MLAKNTANPEPVEPCPEGSGGPEPPGEPAFDIPEPDSTAESSAPAGPQGLYAPYSNIGWEAYTRDRLAAELHRCAAGEQDLVLMVMEITNPAGDDLYYQTAEAAVKFFTLRDLMFERGSRGISLIIPNIDLDRGFSKAEQFRGRIIGSFPDTFPEKNDLRIGISSRSGRLIDADRILLEASQALKKAREDPVSSIVAFKSDPEKYRAFIASQNKSHP
jgi:GGDEF domain-containing protein